MNLVSCAYLNQLKTSVTQLARMAFLEDGIGDDVTAGVLGLRAHRTQAAIICREPIIFCAEAWMPEVLAVYRELCPAADFELRLLAADGAALPAQSRLVALEGNAADIVALERTLLNFLGRALGIACATQSYVAEVRKHTQRTQILDTRKTLPGFRFFDKYAVLCGGGRNHRLGLSDMVLIKENHIAQLGGVTQALGHVRQRLTRAIPIMVEVTDLAQLDEALAGACPLIMLDNFSPEQVGAAMARDLGSSQIEVSGGVSLATIGAYARHEPDRISIGALSHSVKAPDLSLLTHAHKE